MSNLTTPNNFGPEFDFGNIQANKIRLKIGAGLAIQPDGTIVNALPAPVSHVANASIDVQDINANNVTVAWTSQLSEGDWVDNGNNTYTYNESADYIVINAQVHQEIPNTVNRQRPAPVLVLQSSPDGTVWTNIAESATGYIRDATDHEESSNSLFYRDVAPATGTSYRLLSIQESTQGGVVNSTLGQFDLVAITKS